MLDVLARARLVALARGRLAAGATQDEVIGTLRRNGAGKIDCMVILREATGMSLGDLKLLVHHSPTWADEREAAERLAAEFHRANFIECVLGNGRINEPAEEAAECRERQRLAAAQLDELSAVVPADAGYRNAVADERWGMAFSALVASAEREAMPDPYWRSLWTVAETLCLNELLDLVGADGEGDDLQAARRVRNRVRS